LYRQRRLTVPINTLLTSPAETELTVPAGQMKMVSVEFPQGCHSWVYFQLLQGNNPILPDEVDTGITGNAVTLQIPIVYDVEPGRNVLTLRGWSPGSAKAHTITVGVAVLSEIEKTREEEYLSSVAKHMADIARLLGV